LLVCNPGHITRLCCNIHKDVWHFNLAYIRENKLRGQHVDPFYHCSRWLRHTASYLALAHEKQNLNQVHPDHYKKIISDNENINLKMPTVLRTWCQVFRMLPKTQNGSHFDVLPFLWKCKRDNERDNLKTRNNYSLHVHARSSIMQENKPKLTVDKFIV
jgi:hypothetical protein